MVDERLVPPGVWRQIQRSHRYLGDPACTAAEVDFHVAIAWGALIELIMQAARHEPEDAREEALSEACTTAYIDLEHELLKAHDRATASRYARPGPALDLRTKLEAAIEDLRGFPGLVLELDQPDQLPASVGRCVSALRHLRAERFEIVRVDDSREAYNRLALVTLALQDLRHFWRGIFALMFVREEEPDEPE